MDSLTLLTQAQAAGLTVYAEGDRLVVRGPRSAEPLAKTLLAHKAELMPLLTAPQTPASRQAAPPPPPDVTGETHAPASETIEATYQRIWFDYALRDGTYTPEELRQARKVVKPWGPVRTYRLVAVKQYSEPLGRWLFVITEASGDVPPDARFLTPVAGGRAVAWLTAEQLRPRPPLAPEIGSMTEEGSDG